MMRLVCVFLLSILSATQASAQNVSAILEPAHLVALKPSVAGRVSEIKVQEGDVVDAFAHLAQLDARVQVARVVLAERAAAATGPQNRANIVIQQAQTRLDRIRNARSKGAAQPWEVQQAEQTLALAQADAQVAAENAARLKAQQELEERTLQAFSLLSPFQGTVLQILAQPGEIVGPDTPILEIADLAQLKATAFVPENWARNLTVGETLPARLLRNPPIALDARIAAIDPRIDPASRSVRVSLEIKNPEGSIQPGSAIELSAPEG